MKLFLKKSVYIIRGCVKAYSLFIKNICQKMKF